MEERIRKPNTHRVPEACRSSSGGTVLHALALWSYDRATIILVFAVVLTIASLPWIRGLEVDTDFNKLLHGDGGFPAWVAGSGSAGRNPLLVSITAEEGSPVDLQGVRETLAEMIDALDNVSLLSGTNTGQGDPRLDALHLNAALLNQDPSRFDEFLSRMQPPEMERQIRRSRRRIAMLDDPGLREAVATDVLGVFELARPFWVARISETGRALLNDTASPAGPLLLWLRPHGRADNSRFCVELMESLEDAAARAVASAGLPDGVKISYSGLHAMTAESTVVLVNELFTISLWAIGLLLALLLVVLRRVSLVVLCFAPLALSVILLLDVARAFFNPIYFVTVGLVAIVLGLGFDVSVHLAGRLSDNLEALPPREAVATTIRDCSRPLAAGVLSTAVAFLALLATDRTALIEFGLLTAVGLLLTLVTTIMVFPALVRLLIPAGQNMPAVHFRLLPGNAFWFFHRNRRWCFVVGLVLLLISLPLASRFRWHMDPLDFFAGSARSIEATRAMEAATGMALTSAYHIHLEAPDEVSATAALRRIDTSLSAMVRNGQVFGFESPSAFLPYTESRRTDRKETSIDRSLFDGLLRRHGIKRTARHDRYLETLQRAATLPTSMAERTVLVPPEYGTLADLDGDRAAFRIMVWPDTSATGGTPFSNRPAAAAEQILEDLELPDGVRVTVMGTAQILNAIQESVRHRFFEIGLISLLLVLGVLWLCFRNGTSVMLSLAPLLGAVPAMLAGIVLLEIPVTPTAIAFGAVILGVGIDDAVHMVFLSGPPRHRAVPAVLAEIGPVITLTTVSTAIGFGCLFWSSHPVVSSLGGAVVIGVVASWIFTLLLMPTLLHRRGRRRGLGSGVGLLLIMAMFPTVVAAQSNSADELLSRLREQAAKTPFASCTFQQVKTLSQLEQPVEVEGQLLYAHPDRFRIEMHGELNFLLLNDGKRLTLVDLDVNEVERFPVDDLHRHQSLLGPLAMLFDLDPRDIKERFTVERQSGEEGLETLVLRPLRSSSETKEIRLTVDRRLRVRRLEWLYNNGDSVDTEFTAWRKRSRVADDVFTSWEEAP